MPISPATTRQGDDVTEWTDLRPFAATIQPTEQVLVVAAQNGGKSTLVATLTLDVPTLVAIDGKGQMTLPRSRTVELRQYPTVPDDRRVWERDIRRALAYRDGEGETNRVILRPHHLDTEGFDAHDAIFRAIYDRRGTVLWIDEIGATGATANRSQPWLRALTARGRTRGIGLWTCSQSYYGMFPAILRRNASYTLFGVLEAEDAATIRRDGIEIANSIRPRTGRFVAYAAGEREPYRLHLPIPDRLRGWKAP